MNESTIQELFENIQPKLEAGPSKGVDEVTRGLTKFIVEAVKHNLDVVENPRDLVIALGMEFEHGMVSNLATIPQEKVDKALDELLNALRVDIKKGIERVRGTFPS